jgi:hypothetical protein
MIDGADDENDEPRKGSSSGATHEISFRFSPEIMR